MAGFAETVLVNIDIATSKGASALGDLKSKIGDAEGGMGKFKAAVGGAGDALGAMPLPVVGAAAVAVGAAVIKLGQGFADAALDAKKMADATGLNVTASSEWIAAADDVGISTDQISTAFGKATKALGTTPAAFEALGVSVAHAKDGTVDMNATLLNAIDTIKNTEDPTQKAALASKLFGKSWAELTPLIDKGGDSLRETMAATSDAQRITDAEVESSRKWQATMDDLSDVVDNLKMSLGKLVVEGLGPTLATVAEMAQQFSDLVDTLDAGMGGIGAVGEKFAMWVKWLSPVGFSLQVITHALDGMTTAAGLADDALDAFSGFLSTNSVQLQENKGFLTDSGLFLKEHTAASTGAGVSVAAMAAQIDALTFALGSNTHGAELAGSSLRAAGVETNAMADAAKGAEADEKALAAAADVLATAIDGVYDALSRNTIGLLDSQTAQIEANLHLHEYDGTLRDTSLSVDEHTLKLNAMETELINTATKTADAATNSQLFGSEAEKTSAKLGTQISYLNAVAGTLDPGSALYQNIVGYVGQLTSIKASIGTQITADTSDAEDKVRGLLGLMRSYVLGPWHATATVAVPAVPGHASGGLARAGELAMFGEHGAELGVPTQDMHIFTAGQTAGLRGSSGGGFGGTVVYNTTVNMPPGSDGDDVVKALTRWQRRNGPVPISTR